MAYETQAILKTIYAQSLKAESLKEVQRAVRLMLDEEQAAYVEKSVAEDQQEAGEGPGE